MSSIDYAQGMAEARKNAEPLPEGLYPGIITFANVTVSRNSGNDMVRVTMRHADLNDTSNRQWNAYITLVQSGQANFDRIFRVLRTFGASDADIAGVNSREALEELAVRLLVDRPVDVYLTVDVGNDDVARNNVKYFNPER